MTWIVAHRESEVQKGIIILSSHCEGHASAATLVSAATLERTKTCRGEGQNVPLLSIPGTLAQRPVHATIPAKKAAMNPAKLPSMVFCRKTKLAAGTVT